MDIIEITKKDGTVEKMEVVSIYMRSDKPYNYIIYRSLETNQYYTGKYIGEKLVKLDTNLDKEEMEYAHGVFNALVGGE